MFYLCVCLCLFVCVFCVGLLPLKSECLSFSSSLFLWLALISVGDRSSRFPPFRGLSLVSVLSEWVTWLVALFLNLWYYLFAKPVIFISLFVSVKLVNFVFSAFCLCMCLNLLSACQTACILPFSSIHLSMIAPQIHTLSHTHIHTEDPPRSSFVRSCPWIAFTFHRLLLTSFCTGYYKALEQKFSLWVFFPFLPVCGGSLHHELVATCSERARWRTTRAELVTVLCKQSIALCENQNHGASSNCSL